MAKLRNKFSIDLREKSLKKKTRKILKPIVCDHDNELHANPQSCRKYFKCSNGLPSLQSCPTNLIYDSSLKVCNWPDATECIEDPDAVLPELGSSDRHPPKPRFGVSERNFIERIVLGNHFQQSPLLMMIMIHHFLYLHLHHHLLTKEESLQK